MNLRKEIVINFAAKYSNVVIQLILNAILARLLSPKEYGIIAIISVFLVFFNMLGDMGIAPAIIQYKELSKKDISNIFKFTVAIAVALALLFACFSVLVSKTYDNELYKSIGPLLSISVLFSVLSIVPNGILLREKKFKIIGITTLVANFLSGIAAVILACANFGVYALIWNSILLAILNFIILFYYSKIKIYRGFTITSIETIRSYSFYQFLFNFINYFTRNLDNLLIGRFLGQTPLGYYDKSYKLMLYPVQNLTFVISPILQPILSDYQDNREKIYEYYIKIVKVLSLLGVFITAVAFFTAEDLINILFGSQWNKSIISFKVLSLSIGLQIVLSSIGAIFQATNNTKYLFQSGIFSFISFTTLGLLGILIGKTIEWVSFSLSIGFLINFIQSYYMLIKKVFRKNFFSFLKHFIKPIIIQVFLFLFFYLFKVHSGNYFIDLIIKFLCALIVYMFLLFLTGEIKYARYVLKRNI